MKVLLHDSDKTNFPNLALMKLSAAYKAKGHDVEWYSEGVTSDKVISSKVFTFTEEADLPPSTIKGGGGYRSNAILPDSVEHTCPDYSMYGIDYSLGFLTRGCIRKCHHCFVPAREGSIRAHADVEEFLRHKEVVLTDNNVLAHAHGLDQIDKLIRLGVKVDFNQGLDARLIDDRVARRLSKLKWWSPLRLACDSLSQMESIRKAVELLRWRNTTPSRYFCYVLVKDIGDALERIRMLKGLYVDVFAQPFLDDKGTDPSVEQRQLARWRNQKAAYKSCTFDEYVAERAGRI